ncbi:MAG: HIT family protein [Proteobacteria bacterium]|nr:HIT family protein [Pseudomonadota bacterium]
MFSLHPQLAADCFEVADLELSKLLLMDDARFGWCILVPRIEGLKDLHDLPEVHRMTLFDEIDRVSVRLGQIIDAHKINVAALGNMVPQLHIHVIARRTDDVAWPGPVWGVGKPEPWSDTSAHEMVQKLLAK